MNKLWLIAGLTIVSLVFSQTLEEQKEEQERAKRALIQLERDYVLLKAGQFEFEESFSYTYYSANQIYLESFAILDPVFLTLGEFGIERARRHIFTNTFSFRLGILDFFQVEVSVPLVYRYDRISVKEADKEKSLERGGIGDVSGGITIQPLRETHGRPAVLINLSYKSKTGKSPYEIDPKEDVPTGTGYQSVRLNFSFLKTIDPVVVFGSVGYIYNIEENVNQRVSGPSETKTLIKVDPGDGISLSLGFAYAVAYNFSVNASYIQNYVLPTRVKFEGEPMTTAPNSSINSALLKLGTGWTISKRTPLSFSLYVGLTQDSPDYTVELRIPFKF